MPSDEKASAFLEAINKYAEQQRNEIHAEVEQFKEELRQTHRDGQ